MMVGAGLKFAARRLKSGAKTILKVEQQLIPLLKLQRRAPRPFYRSTPNDAASTQVNWPRALCLWCETASVVFSSSAMSRIRRL